MPRRRRRSGKSRGGARATNYEELPDRSRDRVVVQGNFVTVVTTVVSGSAQFFFTITPSVSVFGPRIVEIQDNYRLFRCVALKITCGPISNGQTSEVPMIAFTPGTLVASQPTTIAEVSQFDHMVMAWNGAVRPVQLTLGRRHLAGNVPWYYTEDRTTEPALSRQGTVIVACYSTGTGLATADTLTIRVDSVWEFKDRVPVEVSIARWRAKHGLSCECHLSQGPIKSPLWRSAPPPPDVDSDMKTELSEDEEVTYVAASERSHTLANPVPANRDMLVLSGISGGHAVWTRSLAKNSKGGTG